MATVVRTRVSACPHCGAKIDSATSPVGREPREGDITVCLYCAAVNIFDPELALRNPTEKEAREILQNRQVFELVAWVKRTRETRH